MIVWAPTKPVGMFNMFVLKIRFSSADSIACIRSTLRQVLNSEERTELLAVGYLFSFFTLHYLDRCCRRSASIIFERVPLHFPIFGSALNSNESMKWMKPEQSELVDCRLPLSLAPLFACTPSTTYRMCDPWLIDNANCIFFLFKWTLVSRTRTSASCHLNGCSFEPIWSDMHSVTGRSIHVRNRLREKSVQIHAHKQQRRRNERAKKKRLKLATHWF